MFQIQFSPNSGLYQIPKNSVGIPDYRNSCCIPNIMVNIQNTAHRPTMQASCGQRTSTTAGKMTAKLEIYYSPGGTGIMRKCGIAEVRKSQRVKCGNRIAEFVAEKWVNCESEKCGNFLMCLCTCKSDDFWCEYRGYIVISVKISKMT